MYTSSLLHINLSLFLGEYFRQLSFRVQSSLFSEKRVGSYSNQITCNLISCFQVFLRYSDTLLFSKTFYFHLNIIPVSDWNFILFFHLWSVFLVLVLTEFMKWRTYTWICFKECSHLVTFWLLYCLVFWFLLFLFVALQPFDSHGNGLFQVLIYLFCLNLFYCFEVIYQLLSVYCWRKTFSINFHDYYNCANLLSC